MTRHATLTRQSLLLLASSSAFPFTSAFVPSAIASIPRAVVADPVLPHTAERRTLTTRTMSVLDSFFGKKEYGGSCVMGDESIMSQKAHGTSEKPVQENLRWSCDRNTADRICNFNRHYAEHAGYWLSTPFVDEARTEISNNNGEPITFYDSNTGKPLFVAPKGRDFNAFLAESQSHGWPSFRDDEVVWENVRVLGDGECVSVDGTHLGHNLPDGKGNRYCINLVSVAGQPEEKE